MRLKKWADYNEEEKTNLLLHYWNYYGNTINTMEEFYRYIDLVKSNSKQIFDFIIYCIDNKKNAQELMIYAMRSDNIERLISAFKKYETDNYQEKSEELIFRLVSSYNNPEPSIPLSAEEFFKQLKYIFENNQDDMK